jgi:hypothetical protein
VSWFGRFGLHLAAAVGATGIFVAAAAVGASQTRQSTEIVTTAPTVTSARTPLLQRRERAVPGTIREVLPDALVVAGPRGQEFRVTPAPGALIRLNGRASKLDALQANDRVVILGQAQPRSGFFAHAITARRK